MLETLVQHLYVFELYIMRNLFVLVSEGSLRLRVSTLKSIYVGGSLRLKVSTFEGFYVGESLR